MSLDDIYILAAGFLLVINTALLGTFLLVRRVAMMGDALAHAVLPGIVLAFIFSGTRNPLWMILGASIVGVFTAFLVQFLQEKLKLAREASIGVSFTSFFAIGVLLITKYANMVDLDQDCVLYGELAYVPLNVWIDNNGVSWGPRTLYVLAFAALVVLCFVGFCYKALVLTSFDANFANAMGLSTRIWHYVLMGMVSLVVVAAFEAVGAILVLAFLIVPPACAYLISHRLKTILVLACLFGFLAVPLGYILALYIEASLAGAMTTILGMLFLGVLITTRLLGIMKKEASS